MNDIRKLIKRTTLATLFILLPWQTSYALESLFDISIGPRTDDLNWRATGPVSPALSGRSDLFFSNIESIQLGVNYEGTAESGFTYRASLSVGDIQDGKVRDSDYAGSTEFSRSIADTDGDDVFDASLAFGRRIPVTDTRRTFVTPLIGVSYHEEDFRITNGRQVIDLVSGTAGNPIPGLDSRYRAEWWSRFLGVEFSHRNGNWNTFGKAEFHDLDYEGTGNWNLRPDLANPVSFTHDADGSGPLYQLGTRYMYNNNWAFNAIVTWTDFKSNNGRDRVFLSDGTVVDANLDEAHWDQLSVMFGMSYLSN
ncbi:MAG: hypothetical protein DHS20C01_03480 [marine bacterium B5-7]|nr:MAG: hypothetical protein DHS20C01_03480 [marine bacterium B5-7]